MPPEVSVVMSVYNGEKYLGEAVQSILNQTFKDFEFIIVDDGSTDHSLEIIQQYAQNDNRIRIVINEENMGLSGSLNKGIELAQGEYIARMDADDISLPERFARQASFMESHPEIGICGTWVMNIGKHAGTSWKLPTEDATIRCQLLFNVPLVHPSVMMRRCLFSDLKQRYPDHAYAQDYALWSQASMCTKFSNIPEVLFSYRHHPDQAAQVHRKEQNICAVRVQRDLLERLGIGPTETEIELHNALGESRFLPDQKFIARANDWLKRLALANQRSKTYPEPNFSRVLSERRFWRFPLKMPLMVSVRQVILTWCPPRVYTALRKLWRATRPHG